MAAGGAGAWAGVVGGGLAGCEAAFQAARRGVRVLLAEMRPARGTPAHRTDRLAELVCSNSLRGDSPTNAVGLLKREMAALDSLIIGCAREAAVPAGGALAVDRERFAQAVTDAVTRHPRIVVERREITELPDGPVVVATGPLTSPALHQALERLLGEGALAFYDAIAPIVAADSLDGSRLFRASRYDKGGRDHYLNAPMDRSAYEAFVAALLAAEKQPFRSFELEDIRYFEGCLPIEVMAERGLDTLRFGPMKPVGLADPATGRRPYAVVQLRQDDLARLALGHGDELVAIHHEVQLAHLDRGRRRGRYARAHPGAEVAVAEHVVASPAHPLTVPGLQVRQQSVEGGLLTQFVHEQAPSVVADDEIQVATLLEQRRNRAGSVERAACAGDGYRVARRAGRSEWGFSGHRWTPPSWRSTGYRPSRSGQTPSSRARGRRPGRAGRAEVPPAQQPVHAVPARLLDRLPPALHPAGRVQWRVFPLLKPV